MNSTNTMSNMSNTNPPTARRRSSFQQFERRCSLASLPEDELLELDDDGSLHSVPNASGTARRRSSGNAGFLALGGFSSSAGLSLSLGEFDSDAHLNYGDDAGGPPVVDLPRDFGLDAPSSSSFNSSGAAVVFARGDDGSDVSETDNILNRALHDDSHRGDGNANNCSGENNSNINHDNSNSSLLNSSRSSFKPCKIKRRLSSNRNAKRRGSLNSSNSTAGGASHRSSSHRSSYSHRSSHSTRSSQHSQLTMRSHQTSHSWKFGEWEYNSHVNCSANSTYSGYSYCSDGLSSLYQVLDMGDDESADYESGGSAVDLSDFYEDADGAMGSGVDHSDAKLGKHETTNKSSNSNESIDGEELKDTTSGKKTVECATERTTDNFTASAFHNFHRKSSCGSNDRSCNSQTCDDSYGEKSNTLQDNIMSKTTTITKPTTDKYAVTAKASELLAPKTLELKKSNSTGLTTFPSSSSNENPLQPSSSSSSKPYIRAASAGSATLRGETQTLAALTLQTQPSRSTFTAGMTMATATTYAVAAATGIKRRTIQETLRKDEESFAASLASLRLSNGMPRKQTEAGWKQNDGGEEAEGMPLGMGFGAGETMFGEEWEREQRSFDGKTQTLVGTEMWMSNLQRQRQKQVQSEGIVDGNDRMSSDGTMTTATTTFTEYSNRDDFKAQLDVRT